MDSVPRATLFLNWKLFVQRDSLSTNCSLSSENRPHQQVQDYSTFCLLVTVKMVQLEVTCKNLFSLAIWSCLLLVVLVSFLVMLDVLIIGGGPHALTLATLLSSPDQPLCQSSADILQGIQLSKTKAKSVRYKNKKRQLTSKFKQFVMRTTIWFWFIFPPSIPILSSDSFRSLFQQEQCLTQRMSPNICHVLRCTSKWWIPMENGHHCGKVSLPPWTSLTSDHTCWCTPIHLIR